MGGRKECVLEEGKATYKGSKSSREAECDQLLQF